MTVPTAYGLPDPAQPDPVPSGQEPVLAFRNVTIAFDGPPVLEEITFSLAPGETRILLGPAGVGKSVLLKLCDGLLRPDQGSIQLFGEEIATMPERNLFPLRIRTGMVFQESALFDSLSVRDNVAYQLIQELVPDDEIDIRVREALAFVGLEQTFSLFPSSLSGGMKRRVAIARAFIPSMLVTHRLQDAFTLCSHRFDTEENRMVPLPKGQTNPNTKFLMLEEGRLIFDGTLHDLVKSEDPFVREFLE